METRDEKDEEGTDLGSLSITRAGVVTRVVIQNILRRRGIELSKAEINEELELEVKTIVASGCAAGGALVYEWLANEQKELLGNPLIGLIGAVDPDSIGRLRDALNLDIKAIRTMSGVMHKQSLELHEEWAGKREVSVDGEPL